MAQSENKKNGLVKELTASFKTRRFKAGTYSTLSSLVMIAIVIVVIIFVNNLPSQYTQIDVSDNQMFTISEQTEKVLKNLKEDVTIYLIAQNGQEDNSIRLLLNRYEGYSDKIKVLEKDPVVYPEFASKYTDETIYNNSLIVVSGDKSSYISNGEIYVADYTDYYTTGTYTVTFAGESELTSAINYVTSDRLPNIYMLTGHGETALDSTISKAIKKENMLLSTLSLIEKDSIPEDISCLFIHNPQKDISSEEYEIILEYLENGGRMMLVTDYSVVGELTNIKKLMAVYGMKSVDSCILESDADYYYRANYFTLPNINSHITTDPIITGNYYILMPYAHGIIVDDSATNVTKLLATSEKAFAKTSGGDSIYFEDGDAEGQFTLAAAVEKTVENGTTEIIWFTSVYAFTETYNNAVSGANGDLLLNGFGWMCEAENSISIHAKPFGTQNLTVTSAQNSMTTFFLVFVIPIGVIFIGLAVMLSRRRR